MLKRITSMLLAVVLLLGLFSGQVLAAAQEDISLLAATQTEISLLGANMSIALWKKTNLSTPYANCVSNSVVNMNTVSGGMQPVASYTVTLPNPVETIMLTNTHDAYNYQDEAGFTKACKFKYVVAGQQMTEDGAVKLDINGVIPNGYFSNAVFYEEIVDSTGTVTSSTSQLPSSAVVYDDNAQIPVTLDNGNGKVYIFLLIGKPSTQEDGTTKYTYYANYLPYGFEFVYEAQPADPTPTLTKDLTYGGHLCAPGESLTLSVEATIEAGCNLGYQWYSGTDADDVSTKIEGATTASFTPPTSTPGITFYKVVVTGTADGVDPVSVESAVARVVVRETSVQSFSLETFFDQPVEKLAGSDTVYYLKWSTYAQTNSVSPLAKGDLRMTGKLPDHVTIKNIWTGSAVDNFDMTSERTTLTIDDDTGSFNLNITSSYGNNPAVMHCLEKCYYLELSNNEVYTLVVDNDARAYETERSPKSVQLYDDTEHTALEKFTVTNLQSIDTATSVVRGKLASQTSVVLRAQVQSGGDDLTLGDVPTNSPISWDEGQNSWLMVNGERFPKTGYFSADAEDTQLLTSPAFSLKPGLNVVEVYTEAFSFNFQAFKGYKSSGITEYNFTRSDGEPSTIPVTIAHPVVYLIDYEGQTAAELPSEASNAELLPPVALRMGDYGSKMENCPILFDETTGKYTLRVPTRYKEETINVAKYNHCILLSLRPAAAGARTEILGVNGLVVGQVRSSVLLDIDALRSLGDNVGFAIRVIAPNGTTQKIHVVNIAYASSTTTPEVTVTGAVLDTPFTGDTYAYYLDYASANTDVGTMTVKLPDSSRATVNGTDYTSGDAITLDPKKDFYRLTITAEDNYTVTSYYFVTRYKDTGVIPYQTVSDSSKALAKEMLSGWYDALEGSNMFGNYWRIFMAKATGNRDVSDYNFNRAYVKNPARHEMKQQTDWGACILEIIMLGRNPYDFPRYVNGTYVEHYNYVEGLLNCANGSWANPVWYHMAAKASGATLGGQTTAELLALQTKFDLDIRSWAIASLAECVDTKDMVRFVDGLHDSHNTSGPYTSLWTNQSFHGATGGNTYTIGCVLSAIASAGADPDKQFAYDGHTPLQTIKDVLYVDGLFRPIGGSPDLPKDMIIGLGDVLHGSNVWARYTLTEQKYNDLIAKAKALNVDTSAMPKTFTQTTACGKAYYNLYDAVYDALVAAGRTAEAKEMRPDVIWGMPYEAFADEVNKMRAANELTVDDLADLEKLIAQYEAMDDSSRKAVASDVLAKYQALVAKGLSLKAGDNRAANLYKDILALPDAANIDDSNKEQVKASVDAIRKAMSDADKELLNWAGASVLGKLEAVEKELEDPTEKITVTFTLLGDHVHTETETDVKHTLTAGNLETWIAEDTYQVNPDTTVWDFMQPILKKKGITWDAGTGDSVYVKSLTYEDVTIGEFTNGKLSGWKYTVNGEYPDVSVAAKKLSAGDVVILHYTDDYTVDDNKGGDKPDPAPSGDKYTDQQISDAYKATGNALALKTPRTGSTNGEWLMLGLARAEHTIDSSSKDAYLRSVRSYIKTDYKNGKLSNDKSTENSRIILALTALGEDPQTFVTGKNLLEGYSDFDWTVQQGVTGPIFALLAIDSQKYTVPDNATIRNDLIEEILKAQKNNGGWSADGKTVDVDMTAMAIQALAPYYKKNNTDVVEPVNAALGYLVSQQNEATGAFPNAKSELSAESTAQVIVALTSLGKNPATERRFQAGDKKLSPIDGLMRFYQENGKFSHKLDADANDMATEQSYYALVSYYRLKNDKTSLYDMTDLKDTTPETVASVIEKINDIGPVTENSYEDIIAAEEAYNKLSNADKAQLPEEYLDILNNAKQEYAVLLANKKTDAKKELNDYYLGIDQKDYGEAGRKKLSEILAKAQRDITSAKSCPQVESILRQAISDLDAVRKGDITVSFRLIGSLEATQDVNLTADSYLPEYVTWIPTTKYELASNATVYDLFTEALSDAGLSAIGAEGGYVKTIYAPSCLGGYALSEFTNGKRSGWMYTLNGKHSSNALTDQKLEDGDMVVWHYVNDYSHEVSDWSGDSQHPSLGNGTYYNGWLRAADISPERYVEQLLGKILTVGKNGTVEPKLTLSHLGKSVTFTFKPDKGYRVKDVKVDGKSVGPVASYTVDKLSVSTRIEVTFTNGKLPFTDVRESDWFYDDVVFAYENGLFSGTSDTTFSPNTSMTRAMLVTVLYRLEGQPTVNGRSGFSDVTFNSYYEDAVTWAANNGIVNGTSTSTFSPNANVTREQMAAILYRYAQYKKYNTSASSSLNSFSDHASVSGYAVTPLQWAVAEKLVNGSAGKLMPTGNATRAQVAAILHRFVANVAK